MIRRQWLTILGIMLGVEALFPSWGWSQPAVSPRELERLFYDLWLFSLIGCVTVAAGTALLIRFLVKHHGRGHFPSRVRGTALFAGLGWTLLFVILYSIIGWNRGLPPLPVLSTAKNLLLVLGFAALWYLSVYLIFRVRRWSGLYAMWPARLPGGRS